MRLLIIGGGGREHALVWKLAMSPAAEKIFAVPGNGGIADLADCRVMPPDLKIVADFAEKERIDLTIVGPEAPLVAGIVDEFDARGLPIFGPGKAAARIEGSKAFAKRMMLKKNIPTGTADVFTEYGLTVERLAEMEPPYVIKADGLAGGKGVIIAEKLVDAEHAVKNCLVDKRFGDAGSTVLVEEFLSGEEVSLLSFCDGNDILPLVPAQDYKRVFDGDRGPNTGGMGSYTPVPSVTENIYREIVDRIVRPVVAAMKEEGIDYRGILYTGVILTADGPKVLEFNARFGDPETQAILPRLESDLLPVMQAVASDKLSTADLRWSEKCCVSVVMASSGYPDNPETGKEISGLNRAALLDDVVVFHAGTERLNGKMITAGGRVLNVSALGETFFEARQKAYEACEMIEFSGKQYRGDIGLRAEKFEPEWRSNGGSESSRSYGKRFR